MVCTAAGSSRRERHSDHGIECDPPSAYRSLCIQEASTYRAAVGALAVSQENDDDTQALAASQENEDDGFAVFRFEKGRVFIGHSQPHHAVARLRICVACGAILVFCGFALLAVILLSFDTGSSAVMVQDISAPGDAIAVVPAALDGQEPLPSTLLLPIHVPVLSPIASPPQEKSPLPAQPPSPTLPSPTPPLQPQPPPTVPPPSIPAPVQPPPRTVSTRIGELNTRFHRPLHMATGWEMLGNAGIMVHMFDYWEMGGQEWRPGRQQVMSESIVHYGQHTPGLNHRMPLYEVIPNIAGGMILRPGFTPISCGSVDSCLGREWCESPKDGVHGDYGKPYGGWMGCMWRPADVGSWLEIQATWQRTHSDWERNEFIIDGPAWENALPQLIDAIFITKGKTERLARRVHSNFLQQYPHLTEVDVPLVVFNPDNWETPFSLPGAPAGF